MKQHSEPEALNKAAAYCTPAERCISEVNAKLMAWGIDSDARTRIIRRLVDEKFIDEKRYCRAFVNDKMRFNHWGRIKIAAKLKEKELSSEEIATALADIDEDEYASILHTLLKSKSKETGKSDDYRARQKLLRFAISRGFEYPLILKQLKFDPNEMDF